MKVIENVRNGCSTLLSVLGPAVGNFKFSSCHPNAPIISFFILCLFYVDNFFWKLFEGRIRSSFISLFIDLVSQTFIQCQLCTRHQQNPRKMASMGQIPLLWGDPRRQEGGTGTAKQGGRDPTRIHDWVDYRYEWPDDRLLGLWGAIWNMSQDQLSRVGKE